MADLDKDLAALLIEFVPFGRGCGRCLGGYGLVRGIGPQTSPKGCIKPKQLFL